MPRAALFFLLVAGVLGGSAQAQRALGHAARQPAHSGFGGQRGLNRFFPRRRFLPNGVPRYDALGSYFVPYDEPFGYGYEQPYSEGATHEPVPQLVTLAAPEPPVPKGQLIEIPRGANSTTPQVLPPTVFILVSGERLETRRFVLTSDFLSISIDRQRRNVPLDMLDINATINTNHDRGIDLRIPDDRNEISVSF